jgi:hypothetical protein
MANPTPEQTKAEQERKAQEQKQKAERERQDRSRNAGGSVVSPGAASTYSSAQNQPPMADPRGDRFLTRDEIKNLAGDINVGEIGWIKLDEEGKPVEPAKMDSPFLEGKSDGTFARVVGAPTHKYDEIVTPSGAPVTRFMNPDPVLWDEGMLARNPIPEENKPKRGDRAIGGVVNQPVSYGP